jgi:hypothetical protein
LQEARKSIWLSKLGKSIRRTSLFFLTINGNRRLRRAGEMCPGHSTSRDRSCSAAAFLSEETSRGFQMA